MTIEELRQINVYQWEAVKGNYKAPDILLGNGFSINQNKKFVYKSLFETFLTKCPAHLIDAFKLFKTTNFELILKYLKYAFQVNTVLKLETKPIQEAIEVLRNGLIATIEEVHPRIGEIDKGRIEKLTLELADFGNIFTTNYDLYLYHIIMKAKDIKSGDKKFRDYNDYFWGTWNSPAGFMEFVSKQEYDYKHIYYLHGALFIFPYRHFNIKITRGSDIELIDIIAEEIRKDNFPLFVSEGSAEEKKDSIDGNKYLSFCLWALRKSDHPLVIYGNSLSEVDQHIVDAIKFKPRPLIFCLYPVDKSKEVLEKEKADILVQFPKEYGKDITFVDSRSLLS